MNSFARPRSALYPAFCGDAGAARRDGLGEAAAPAGGETGEAGRDASGNGAAHLAPAEQPAQVPGGNATRESLRHRPAVPPVCALVRLNRI